MAPFSLEKAATPARARARSPPGLPLKENRKIPKVDDLVAVVEGPRPPVPRRLPSTADIVVAIYKYTNDASTVWEDVREPGLALWQVQVQHEARDSICFQIQEKFNAFLAQHGSAPCNLVELQRQALINMVVTDGQDPNALGTFQRWRPAFYVAGSASSLKNLLYLLDEWWTYLMKDKTVCTNIWLHPHVNVDIDECWDNFEYPAYTLEERAAHLPVGCFEAHPPQGKRVLLIELQVESGNVLSCVFQNCWSFRDAMDAHGVSGLRDENNVYYRVVQSVDVSSEQAKERLLSVLAIFQNLAARVTVEGRAKSGGAVHALLRDLRAQPHLHFA